MRTPLAIKDANGNDVIKKGKDVKKSLSGKNDVVQVREKWMTFVPKIVAQTIPMISWSDSYDNNIDTSYQGLSTFKVGGGRLNKSTRPA